MFSRFQDSRWIQKRFRTFMRGATKFDPFFWLHLISTYCQDLEFGKEMIELEGKNQFMTASYNCFFFKVATMRIFWLDAILFLFSFTDRLKIDWIYTSQGHRKVSKIYMCLWGVEIQGLWKEKVLFLFLPKSEGIGKTIVPSKPPGKTALQPGFFLIWDLNSEEPE